MRYLGFFVVVIATILAVTSITRADGLIVVENGERVAGHFAYTPLEVRFHRVNVLIDDDVATTDVDQEFFNPASTAVEGTYFFPVPENAHIDKFAMDVDGKTLDAELLSSDKAREIYEDIVRRKRDPALLEYAGRSAFKARIFPIEAHGSKRVRIKYTQLLKPDAGFAEYGYSLDTEKFSSRSIGEVAINVRLHSADPLKTITCPTHDTVVTRTGDHDAAVISKWSNIRPDTDFKLLFSRDRKEIGLHALTFKRDASSDGYFMLLASPGFANALKTEYKPTGKDIVFVLDTSGSMQGRKLEQAKKALAYCLSNLRPEDSFNVVCFSSETTPFFPTLISANDKTKVTEALDRVADLKSAGGTAIDDALAAALKLKRGKSDVPSPPFTLVFLTDGLPTIGVVAEDGIVRHVQERSNNSRIFCFGLGNDVNTHLLDRLSDSTQAASTYVAQNEDLELKLSSFFDKISEPVATDVKLAVEGNGIEVSQQYPGALPDLFKGQTMQVFGRYKGAGSAKVKLSAMVNGQRQEFVEQVQFTDHDTSSDFIPTMWATRRVGWLLDEMRQHGESTELRDEVVQLARQHGIVTPYTAYLITEDESRRNVPLSFRGFQQQQRSEVERARLKDAYDSTQREAKAETARTGDQAVVNSVAVNGMKAADNVGASYQSAGMPRQASTTQPGYRAQDTFEQAARNVAGRSFYQNGSRWTDTNAQSLPTDQKIQNVKFNSDEYFALLNNHPEAAAWLALSNEVDVVIENTLYQIREEN